MSAFCPRVPSRHTLHLVIPSPLRSLACDSSSDFPCFSWPWQFWGVLAGQSEECPSIGVGLMFLKHLSHHILLGGCNHHVTYPRQCSCSPWPPGHSGVCQVSPLSGSCFPFPYSVGWGGLSSNPGREQNLCMLFFLKICFFSPVYSVIYQYGLVYLQACLGDIAVLVPNFWSRTVIAFISWGSPGVNSSKSFKEGSVPLHTVEGLALLYGALKTSIQTPSCLQSSQWKSDIVLVVPGERREQLFFLHLVILGNLAELINPLVQDCFIKNVL